MRNILYILIFIFLCACSAHRQIVEIPVEVIKTEYVHDTKIDSIYVRDSIDKWWSGDTVFIYKDHTEYKYIARIDTVIKTDTIPKIINTETVKEVKINYITWYQSMFMWLGIGLSILLIIVLIIKLKFK